MEAGTPTLPRKPLKTEQANNQLWRKEGIEWLELVFVWQWLQLETGTETAHWKV